LEIGLVRQMSPELAVFHPSRDVQEDVSNWQIGLVSHSGYDATVAKSIKPRPHLLRLSTTRRPAATREPSCSPK
jgi:hypothetical protein